MEALYICNAENPSSDLRNCIITLGSSVVRRMLRSRRMCGIKRSMYEGTIVSKVYGI